MIIGQIVTAEGETRIQVATVPGDPEVTLWVGPRLPITLSGAEADWLINTLQAARDR